jgi:hypothetical protein
VRDKIGGVLKKKKGGSLKVSNFRFAKKT